MRIAPLENRIVIAMRKKLKPRRRAVARGLIWRSRGHNVGLTVILFFYFNSFVRLELLNAAGHLGTSAHGTCRVSSATARADESHFWKEALSG